VFLKEKKKLGANKSLDEKGAKDAFPEREDQFHEYNYYPNANNGYTNRNPPKNVKMHSQYGVTENIYLKEENTGKKGNQSRNLRDSDTLNEESSFNKVLERVKKTANKIVGRK